MKVGPVRPPFRWGRALHSGPSGLREDEEAQKGYVVGKPFVQCFYRLKRLQPKFLLQPSLVAFLLQNYFVRTAWALPRGELAVRRHRHLVALGRGAW